MRSRLARLFPTLYLRIAAAFALILLFLGGLQLYVYLNNWLGFLQESEQRTHWGVAEQLARKIEPLTRELLYPERLEELVSELLLPPAQFNLYLLDREGNITFHQMLPSRIVRPKVSLAPIEKFLNRKRVGQGAILGDNPLRSSGETIFSAWPVSVADAPGYVYVVLGASNYERVLRAMGEEYLVNASANAALLSLITAMAVGLLAFYFLTLPLRRLTHTVAAFQQGDFSVRLEARSGDELQTLAETFNEMAGTIEEKIDELKQQDSLRRELVANISHDLRSPVTAVRSSLETIALQFDSLDRAQIRSYLDASLSSLQFLQNLVTELFELSKLEARTVAPALEAFSIIDLCDDVVGAFRSEASLRSITLELQGPEDLKPVHADMNMMHKVMVNLVGNAIRYSEPGGSVAVCLEPRPTGVAVSVVDSGIGIPADALPRIFDRFYRVEQSRERSRGGTGLGLAIVKRILESHDIEISVKSTVGRGTTFSFTVPYVA